MEAHLSANKSHPLPEADHAFLLFPLHLPSLGPHESSLSRARIPRHSVPWNSVSGNVAFACSNTCAALCTRTEPLSVPFASAQHLHLMTDCAPPPYLQTLPTPQPPPNHFTCVLCSMLPHRDRRCMMPFLPLPLFSRFKSTRQRHTVGLIRAAAGNTQ